MQGNCLVPENSGDSVVLGGAGTFCGQTDRESFVQTGEAVWLVRHLQGRFYFVQSASRPSFCLTVGSGNPNVTLARSTGSGHCGFASDSSLLADGGAVLELIPLTADAAVKAMTWQSALQGAADPLTPEKLQSLSSSDAYAGSGGQFVMRTVSWGAFGTASCLAVLGGKLAARQDHLRDGVLRSNDLCGAQGAADLLAQARPDFSKLLLLQEQSSAFVLRSLRDAQVPPTLVSDTTAGGVLDTQLVYSSARRVALPPQTAAVNYTNVYKLDKPEIPTVSGMQLVEPYELKVYWSQPKLPGLVTPKDDMVPTNTTWFRRTVSPLCVSAASPGHSGVTLGRFPVLAVRLTHVSGFLSCNGQAPTRWGCTFAGVGIYLTPLDATSEAEVIYPTPGQPVAASK